MIVRDYTLSELVDLALRVPEIGAVNFNILHVVLQNIIQETNLKFFKPLCNIENPVLAQAALTQAKLKAPPLKRSLSDEGSRVRLEKPSASKSVQEPSEKQAIPSGEQRDFEREISEEHVEEDVDREPDERDTDYEGDGGLVEQEPKVVEKRTFPEISEASIAHEDISKETQFMSDSWRDTNLGRRLNATEEGITSMSYVVDRLTDKINDISLDVEYTLKEMNLMIPKFQSFDAFITNIESTFITREELIEVTERTKYVEVNKTDANDVKEIISKHHIALGREEITYNDIENLKKAISNMKKDIKLISNEIGLTTTSEIRSKTSEKRALVKDGKEKQEVSIEGDDDEESMKERTIKKTGSEIKDTEIATEETLGDRKEERDEEKEKDEEEEKEVEDEEDEETEEEDEFFDDALKSKEKQRMDKMWKQLMKINAILNISDDSDEEPKRAEEQVKLMRDLLDQVDTLKCRNETMEAEFKKKTKLLLNMQNSLDDMQLAKAEKSELLRMMEDKASKEDLDNKVDREEFVATVEDLGDSIEGLVARYQKMNREWRSAIHKAKKNIALKLNIEDYEVMQNPIRIRIRGLMYGFNSMKSLIHSTLYPDAAGVTKCVSCGRPAELAGSKFQACGDCGPIRPQEPKPLAPSITDHSGSDNGNESSTNKSRSVKEMEKSGNPFVNVQHQLGSDSSASKPKDSNNVKRSKNKNGYSSLHESRYCGGKHTVTSPMDRAKKFDVIHYEQQTKHPVNLVAYDNSVHKGVTSSESCGKFTINIPEKTEDLDEILKSCYDPFPDPPKDYNKPRYCGSSHTKTNPLQRGIHFAPLQMSETPAKLVDLYGVGGGIFQGKEKQSSSTEDSKNENFSNTKEDGGTFQQVNIVTLPCGPISKQNIVKTQIISLDLPENNLVQINSNILKKRKTGYKNKPDS